jgi:hypothetical protein
MFLKIPALKKFQILAFLLHAKSLQDHHIQWNPKV